ncbi:hypothetical protein ACFLZP_02260 [Patescibacteria group bacterium]
MTKKFLFISLFSLFFIYPHPTWGKQSLQAGSSALPKKRVAQNKEDHRIQTLTKYLEEQNSPLSQYAPLFIQMADKYHLTQKDLDYLVPAITGLESSYGKRYLQGSYNAYGWGGGYWLFSSWPESIEYVTRRLKERYLDRGADTIAKIGPIYAESPTWAQRVAMIEKKIRLKENLIAQIPLTL